MTRRTQFKGTSRARRRERLKAKALANGVLAREEAITSEVLHRPTLSRAQIQAKGKHETPKRIEDAKSLQFMAKDAFWQLEEYRRNLERAAIVYANEFGHKPAETGVCLPDVAIYNAGYRGAKYVTAR
ncbi:antitermination protein [Salmonella enterica]|nr:antitermination protein [Salmonella enterica]EHM8665535.1 antitermination protein [Salmonella enterica subsp. enterica serovar Newport]EHF5393743.1 antitermination protein [Salmonella enterica]EHF8183600.1 antitermination protein [Salmonella enterica]EHF8211488.1 antitermination protein [Salmonella enterica]